MTSRNSESPVNFEKIAHKLKAKITTIQGYSALIDSKMRQADDKKTKTYWKRLKVEIRELVELVNVLLKPN